MAHPSPASHRHVLLLLFTHQFIDTWLCVAGMPWFYPEIAEWKNESGGNLGVGNICSRMSDLLQNSLRRALSYPHLRMTSLYVTCYDVIFPWWPHWACPHESFIRSWLLSFLNKRQKNSLLLLICLFISCFVLLELSFFLLLFFLLLLFRDFFSFSLWFRPLW